MKTLALLAAGYEGLQPGLRHARPMLHVTPREAIARGILMALE